MAKGTDPYFAALQVFAEEVRQRFDSHSTGEPEDQLRGPLERLFQAVGEAVHRPITTVGETHIRRLGRPDYAVDVDALPGGHIELNALGGGRVNRSVRLEVYCATISV